MHRIAEKLRAEFTAQIGHKPAQGEFNAWQNSLMALSTLVDQAELNDRPGANGCQRMISPVAGKTR